MHLSETLPTIIRYIIIVVVLFFTIKYAIISASKSIKDNDQKKL